MKNRLGGLVELRVISRGESAPKEVREHHGKNAQRYEGAQRERCGAGDTAQREHGGIDARDPAFLSGPTATARSRKQPHTPSPFRPVPSISSARWPPSL